MNWPALYLTSFLLAHTACSLCGLKSQLFQQLNEDENYSLWTHYTLTFWHEPRVEMDRFREVMCPWMQMTLLFTVRATLSLTPPLCDESKKLEYFKMLFPLLFFESRSSTEKHAQRVSYIVCLSKQD